MTSRHKEVYIRFKQAPDSSDLWVVTHSDEIKFNDSLLSYQHLDKNRSLSISVFGIEMEYIMTGFSEKLQFLSDHDDRMKRSGYR